MGGVGPQPRYPRPARPQRASAARKAFWSLTTLREKLIKIGAKVVRHGQYITFHLAEAAIPKALFAESLRRIDGLRPAPFTLRHSVDYAGSCRSGNEAGAFREPRQLVRFEGCAQCAPYDA